jgi:glucosamine kinase
MQNGRKDDLYFCVDGGGSQSRARLINSRGQALAEAAAGPCNPSTNFDKAVEGVRHLWGECAASIGRRTEATADVVFALGAAGTYLEGRARFIDACPQFARVSAMSDGYAALIGAGEGEPSSLLIIGTGIAGHKLYPSGLSVQRDAWGWIAGDRGSGSWMGQRAVRHFFAVLDGVVPEDGLSRSVGTAIGGIEAIRAGWMRDLGPYKLASFAPIVLQQAEAGNAVARRIRDRAVEHLAALIQVIAGDDTPLYAAGGLVKPLRAPLSAKAAIPILEPRQDALIGCWLVACGRAPEERVLLSGERLEQIS